MARRASSRQRGATHLQEREGGGRELTLSAARKVKTECEARRRRGWARRAIGDVLASSWAPKRSHRPVAPPSAPPRAATVRPTVLAYTG